MIDNVKPAASEENFEHFKRNPLFEASVDLIAGYLSEAFDEPAAVEVDEWTLACLPSTGRSGARQRLFTLNIGPMEVLTVQTELEDGVPVDCYIMMYVSASALEIESGCTLDALAERTALLDIRRTDMASADGDGAVIGCRPTVDGALDQLDQLLLHENTIRPLAKALVAKGKGSYEQYHNRLFAAHVLAQASADE
ncbi:hypothetical protein [Rhodococcus sp. NPDC059234]|uniref:hypothetical protein n=1 Tax=Rhodococcus sp. NPDC059234 TaxID=3346781 RepID=UPI00366ED5E8